MATTSGISDEAVRKATGRSWDEWLATLSAAGAGDWTHKDIVAWLAAHTELSGWWQQSVAVAFEKATGRRVLGETADAGFQVGVRITIAAPRDWVWETLVSPDGQQIWLDASAALEPKTGYRSSEGVYGEIRVVRPRDRIRFTRCLPEGAGCSTVQIALTAAGNSKTALTFHHEKLRSADEREAMRSHWKAVARQMKQLAEEPSGKAAQ